MRSSAGAHSEEIRDLRTDLQPRVFIFVNGLYTRDGPINLQGELLNSALVKRFVILTPVYAVLPASRLEARADPLQKNPDLFAKCVHLRLVDQLQHRLGIHERNRYGPIGFFAHDNVARQ